MANSKNAFLSLVCAGLWEKEIRFLPFGSIDYSVIYSIAEVQGVTGLVAAGLEHVADFKPAKKDVVQFIGRTVHIEQRNREMNDFIATMVNKMRGEGIYAVLVKGQGIAQCYKRPLWRPSGDVDFLLDDSGMLKADSFYTPMSKYRKVGGRYSKEIGFGIDSWTVEVHGSLRSGLSSRIDKEIDFVQEDVFKNGNVRVWRDNATDILLPAPDNDVFLVFTHFIKHFYKGGAVLRQICDWVRLLWTYRDTIDASRLERWVRRAGLMGEWRAFAAMAVDNLGMPKDAMPFYDRRYRIKGGRVLDIILDDSIGNKMSDTFKIAKVFPWKAFVYSPSIFLNVNALKITERVLGSHD